MQRHRYQTEWSRRDCLRLGVGAALAGLSGWPANADDRASTEPKAVLFQFEYTDGFRGTQFRRY